MRFESGKSENNAVQSVKLFTDQAAILIMDFFFDNCALHPPSKWEFNGRIPPLEGAGGCYSSKLELLLIKQQWSFVDSALLRRQKKHS